MNPFVDRYGHPLAIGNEVSVEAGKAIPPRKGNITGLLADGRVRVQIGEQIQDLDPKEVWLVGAVPRAVHRDIRAGSPDLRGTSFPKPPITQAEYLQRFKDEVSAMIMITESKNRDYASGDDAFQNFRMVESIGLTSVEIGILTRMSDKFQRIANLIQPGREAKVKNESILDTLRDLANYSIILAIYLGSK